MARLCLYSLLVGFYVPNESMTISGSVVQSCASLLQDMKTFLSLNFPRKWELLGLTFPPKTL